MRGSPNILQKCIMEISLVDERLDSREFPSERVWPVSKSLNPREQIPSHPQAYIQSPSLFGTPGYVQSRRNIQCTHAILVILGRSLRQCLEVSSSSSSLSKATPHARSCCVPLTHASGDLLSNTTLVETSLWKRVWIEGSRDQQLLVFDRPSNVSC